MRTPPYDEQERPLHDVSKFNLKCRVLFQRILIMLMYFLCFRARDIVVMQSVTKFRA